MKGGNAILLTCAMIVVTLLIWFVLAELIYPFLAYWGDELQRAGANITNLKAKEIVNLIMVALTIVMFAVPVYFIESNRR